MGVACASVYMARLYGMCLHRYGVFIMCLFARGICGTWLPVCVLYINHFLMWVFELVTCAGCVSVFINTIITYARILYLYMKYMNIFQKEVEFVRVTYKLTTTFV